MDALQCKVISIKAQFPVFKFIYHFIKVENKTCPILIYMFRAEEHVSKNRKPFLQ